MQLELSRDSSTNTVLSLNGCPLYHIHTPGILSRKTTTIYKIPETTVRRYEQSGKKTDVEPNSEEEIARIHWHTIHSSKLIYDGRSVDLSKFLELKGFLRNKRIFTGPDGNSYKWCMDFRTSTLKVNDGSKPAKVIAKLYQGNFLTGKKSFLEVDESASFMLDLIIIMLVFVETRRRDRERQHAAGGAGGSS